MNGLLSMIGMQTELEYQMGDDFPFGVPRIRFNVPNGNIPSDKQKCQPKAQHEFTIKGIKIMAASKKDAIKPIPLTPEILEKNGWKKKVMSRGVKNSHWVYTKPDIEEYGYFPIYIEKGIGDEFDVYPFTGNNVCTQIAYIKYVHQLQHLLFGLGLNSEMEV